MITSVGFPATTLIAPPVPAGTIAEFATTLPFEEFNVDTPGYGCPVGQIDRNPKGPCGTAVMFKEYACAIPETPQALDRIGKLRVVLAAKVGGPNEPVKPSPVRVSATRQGGKA